MALGGKKQSIKGDGNTQINVDGTYNNFVQQEIVDMGIIDELFKYIRENIDNVSEQDKSKPDAKMIKVDKKIKINFKGEDVETVKTFFVIALEKTSLIEKKISELDSNDQKDLHSFVFTKYIENKAEGMTNIKNLLAMFNQLTPADKLQNPLYSACAKALVLFFLGDCTIFEKTPEEKQKPNLLF